MSSETSEKLQSAALRRSDAYLAETQRLTRTGSFAIEVATQAVTYSSAEHSRLYGFDPARGLPSIDDFFARIIRRTGRCAWRRCPRASAI